VTPRQSATVKVVIHTAWNGDTAIGIIGSTHLGPRRIDLRLVPARPVPDRAADAPRGVPGPLWLAMLALEREVDRLQADAAKRR